MKRVKRRATAALLAAALIFAGFAVYLTRLAEHGGAWATYFNSTAGMGAIVDRNGVLLYKGDSAGWSFSDDWTTRVSCYHVVGDAAGNVGTGALQQFRGDMSGYNFITGSSGGSSLKLTVDSALNAAAYSALWGRGGSVLVMNYKTGEILCMVSSPGEDPAWPAAYPAEGTYINKCISSSFVPGSVFKLVTLAAAIESIPDLYTRSFGCEGAVTVDGSWVNCTGYHGEQTIEQALANSCNCAFAQLALELGGETIAAYAEKYGFTSAHELDGIPTAAGRFDVAKGGSSDEAWSGIGQYNDLISPYAMLRYVSAIANGGSFKEPTIKGRGLFAPRTKLMSADTAGKIADMMDYNVQYAYGAGSFPGLAVCAKTGTAEVGDGSSHAWFAGFLRDEGHPYAFVVLVERGGGGLAAAGSVANAVLQAAVNN